MYVELFYSLNINLLTQSVIEGGKYESSTDIFMNDVF